MTKLINLVTTLKQSFVAVLLTLFMIGLPYSGVYAQEVIDVEAPTIEHEEIESGVAGEMQSFIAEVKDNNSVQSVTLYYRLTGTLDFTRLDMVKQQKDRYLVEVPTDAGVDTTIQYYIEAIDVGNTKISRGFSFNPLERAIVAPAPVTELAAEDSLSAENPTDNVAQNSESQVEISEPKKRKTWLYVAGGVLALGLIAGLSGGSDDDGGSPVAQPCCNVTFTVSPP